MSSVVVYNVIKLRSSVSYTVRSTLCAAFQEVTAVEYRNQLAAIGIVLRAKNCLVFQGEVDTIATMTPKERCAVLDEFSGYVVSSFYSNFCI